MSPQCFLELARAADPELGTGGHPGPPNEPSSAEAGPAGTSGPWLGQILLQRFQQIPGDRTASGTDGICCLQVEPELHRKQVLEAWGDQLMQKPKVRWGRPGVREHLGRLLRCTSR